MRIKALIFDLDNTIYPVSSIGDKLFKSLFELIEESGKYEGDLQEIKKEVMRWPFQRVADDFSFSDELKSKCLDLLSDLTYEDKMEPFNDYKFVQTIPCKKYLVTTGFTKLQNSKIKQLNLEADFDKLYVVDPGKSDLTKKDIFQQILEENNYKPTEVLVIGDDPESEINAARELEVDTILYKRSAKSTVANGQKLIGNYSELIQYCE
jgi:putative hydrolase of the HAD superfamily